MSRLCAYRGTEPSYLDLGPVSGAHAYNATIETGNRRTMLQVSGVYTCTSRQHRMLPDRGQSTILQAEEGTAHRRNRLNVLCGPAWMLHWSSPHSKYVAEAPSSDEPVCNCSHTWRGRGVRCVYGRKHSQGEDAWSEGEA